MSMPTTIGIDTGKNSFSLYGIDKNNKKAFCRDLCRAKLLPYIANLAECTIFMESCSASHHWAREFQKLGHTVKLIAAQKVVPFGKNNKNDKNDAMAILQAGLCHGMEFVGIKTVEQQSILSVHRIRDGAVRQKTKMINQIRGLLREFGYFIPVGVDKAMGEIPKIVEDLENELPGPIRAGLTDIFHEILNIIDRIDRLNSELENYANNSAPVKRLLKIEGIGVLTATAMVAAVPDPNSFKNGRQFAAWLGLVPGHRQTGGVEPVMLGITKKGDQYLRKLLVQGALSVAIQAKAKINATKAEEKAGNIETENKKLMTDPQKNDKPKIGLVNGQEPCKQVKKTAVGQKKVRNQSKHDWYVRLLEEKYVQKAAVAYANKNARIILAMLKSGDEYMVSAAI